MRKIVAEVRSEGATLVWNEPWSSWQENTKTMRVQTRRYQGGPRNPASRVLFTMAHEWGHHLAWRPGGFLRVYFDTWKEDQQWAEARIRCWSECNAWIAGEAYIPLGWRQEYWDHALRCLGTYGFDAADLKRVRENNR